jgi:PAS domain S-box-containing protein
VNDTSGRVILLVEDERVSAKIITRILEKHGYTVIHAATGEEAVLIAGSDRKIDLLLSDIELGGGIDGTAAAEEILRFRNIPALFLTSHTEPEIVGKTEKIYSYGYVVKNTGETVLIASMNMAFKLFEAREIISNQKQEIEASAEEMIASIEELQAINEELITTQKQLIESEGKYRRLHESMTEAYVMIDLNGSYIESNNAFQKLTGYTTDELVKLSYKDITPEKWHQIEENIINEAVRSRQSTPFFEKEYIKKDGSFVPVELRVFVLPDEQGNETALWAIVRDITERKAAEERAALSEKLIAEANNMFQLVIDTIPSRILWKGLDFKFLGCNRLVAMDAGVSDPKTLIGLNDFDTQWKDQAEFYRADDMNVINSGKAKINYEEKLTQSNGKVLWLNTTKVPLRNIDGEIIGILATWEDITEKKNAMESLNVSEERFRSIIQSSSDMIFIVDSNGIITYESPSVTGILGYPEGFFTGKTPFSLVYPEDLETVIKDMEQVNQYMNDGLPTEFRLWKADNTLVYLEAIASNLIENPAVNGIVLTARDISERKKAEEAIRLSEEKFRNIYETMTIGYFRTSMEGNLLDLNPACLKIFGFESLEEAKKFLHDNSANVYADYDEWLRIRSDLSDNTVPSTYTVRLLKKDKSEFFANLNLRHVHKSDGTPLHLEGLIEDISERIKTQELLIQSEKMITVAGLAAGMAHEINNPLGIIMQNAENAKNRLFGELPGNINAAKDAGTELRTIRKYAESRRINTYLDDIHEAGTRAAKIVENMLQFTRATESRFSYLNINSLIDRAIDLAMNDYDLKKKYDFRKIKIIKNYSELPEIQCHETQIEQVFLSIFKNAAQAMNSVKFDETGIPTLKINTYSQNGTSTIEISDNGPGMDEQTRRKIFEPFFTTKEPGAGTGLGLSVSFYIIVTGHGGTISVESSPGKGSIFIITLPEIRRNR